MSKNKKSMKNSKKRVNNYKIESLEPRLMMDASMDGWNQELNIASTSFSSDLTTVASAEWKNSYVETLQTKNSSEEYEQTKAKDILEAANLNDATHFVDPAVVKAIKADFKSALHQVVVPRVHELMLSKNYKDLFANPTSSQNAERVTSLVIENPVYQLSLDTQEYKNLFKIEYEVGKLKESQKKQLADFVTDVKTTIYKAEDIYDNWVSSSVGYSVKLCDSDTSLSKDTLLFEISNSVLGTISDPEKIRANISDFSGVSVKLALLESDNVALSGTRSIAFNGDGKNLERNDSALSVEACFRQLEKGDNGKNFGFGEENKAADANGYALNLESSNSKTTTAYTAGVNSSGENTHSGKLIFDVVGASTWKFADSKVTYEYDDKKNEWVWSGKSAADTALITKLENFRIGPVMQKISNLAYWLHENSTITKENPSPLLLDNFGGLLNQNVSELAEFSSLLDDIILQSPKTLNDFVSLKHNVNKSNAISVSIAGSSLVFSFNIEGADLQNKNVSLVTSKLAELGFDVSDNQSLNLNVSGRQLKFKLEVPLDGSLDLSQSSSVQEALGNVDPKNVGNVIGAAYVQANSSVKRKDLGSFYSAAVNNLRPSTGQTEWDVSFTFQHGSISEAKSIKVESVDFASDIVKKIKSIIPDWLKEHIEIESYQNGTAESLFFIVDDGYILGCSLLTPVTSCDYSSYYELISNQFFDEKAVRCAYYDMQNVSTVSSGEKFTVTFKYTGSDGTVDDVTESFKYVAEDGDWRDCVVALIANNPAIQKDKIRVKIFGDSGKGYKLVFVKQDGDNLFKNISVSIKHASSDALAAGSSYTSGYLYTSDMLPIDCSSWSGGDLEINLYGTSSVNDKLTFGNDEFKNVSSLDDIIRIIKAKISSSKVLSGKVVCEIRNGLITFRAARHEEYSEIELNGSILTNLGFSASSVSGMGETKECLEITLWDKINQNCNTSFKIALPDTIKENSKIGDVVNAIVQAASLKGYNLVFKDGCLKGDHNYDIVSIKDINGCTIGSILGIVGKAEDGFVFRVSGINKSKAENSIKIQNVELYATPTVTGTPSIKASVGPVETTLSGGQVKFKHTMTFKEDSLIEKDVVAISELMRQCSQKINNLLSNVSFDIIIKKIQDASSFSFVFAEVQTLKNDVIDASNKLADFVDVFDKLDKYFESIYSQTSLGKIKTSFESLIAQIKTFVEMDFSSLDLTAVQSFLNTLNALPSALTSIKTEYQKIASSVETLVDDAKKKLTKTLNDVGTTFSFTPEVGTALSSATIGDSDILQLSLTLKDEAAQAKANLTGLMLGSIAPSIQTLAPIALQNPSLEKDLLALDALNFRDIADSIVSKLDGDTGFVKNFMENDWLKVQLPILGRSFSDICGAASVLNEIQNFFRNAQNITLQDMSDAFTKLGITAIPQWVKGQEQGKGHFTINLSKEFNLSSQKIQLDNLCSYGAFHFGGDLEAYLDIVANIRLTIDVEYKYTIQNGVVVMEAISTSLQNMSYTEGGNILQHPLFDASITLKIPAASAELNVGFGELSSPLLKVCGGGDELLFKASCAVDIDSGSKIAVKSVGIDAFNGKLNVEALGIQLGAIEFGIADGKPYSLNCDSFNVEDLLPTLVVTSGLKNAVGSEAVKGVKIDESTPKTGLYVNLSVLDTDSFSKLDLFEKLRLVADGLSESLRKMQSGLNKQVLSKSMRNIPLIGDKIVSVADCLSMLDSKFIEPFRKYVFNAKGMSAETVAEKLYLMLNKAGLLNALGSGSETWAGKEFNKYYKGVQYYSSDTEAGWRIQLGGTYTLDPSADFDIGFPGLGLRADGGVKLELKWTLDIGFGVDQNKGAFLLLSSGVYDEDQKTIVKTGDDLNIELNITVDKNSGFSGSLGFLEMKAAYDPIFGTETTPRVSKFSASLGIDLNDGTSDKNDGRLKDAENDSKLSKQQIYVSGLGSGLSVEANFDAQFNAYLNLLLTAGEMFPSINSNFAFEWSAGSGIQYLAFEDLTLDAGQFIDKMFGGIVTKVKKVIEPIQPLIDFLQSEIPVLNKLPAGAVHITVLDLIKQFGKGKMDFGFLDDIIQLNQIVKMLATKHEGSNSITLNLPNLVLFDWDKVSYGADETSRGNINKSSVSFLGGVGANIDDYIKELMQTFELAKSGTSELERISNKISGLADKGYDKLSSELKRGGLSVESRLDVKQVTAISSDPYGWQFPIIQEPIAQVVGLLMGKQADLVTYHMRPLAFNFNWANSYPIVGPLCADIGFNFGVCFDLKFGYDTYGMVKWKDSHFKDPTALLDGFYIADWDSSGKDIAEVVFHSGVVAGASVCGRAGINVALNLDVNLNFNDPNNDGKVRLREMAKMISKPITMFDVSATIEMEAYAYLDYFIGRKKWVLWSSGAFELFDTASKSTPTPILISDLGEDRVVNVGDFAANRSVGDLTDGEDVVTITVTDSNRVDVGWKNDLTKATGSSSGKVSSDQILYLYTGELKDTITISGENVKFNIVIYCGAGTDEVDLSGLKFADGFFVTVYGGAGNDIIKGANAGTNFLFGDGGYTPTDKDDKKKILSAYNYYDDEEIGGNVIFGGENANNYIFGGFAFDQIVAGEGKVNYIFGDGGRVDFDDEGKIIDVRSYDLYDEGGDDVIFGGSNIDHIYGGAGADHIDGGAGDDEIHGGKGHDVIYGGAGNDEIYGDDGVDIIYGDAPVFEDMLIANSTNKSGKRNVPSKDDPEKLKEVSETVIPWKYVSDELKKTSDDEDAADLTEIRSNRNIGRHIDKNELDSDFAKMNPYSAPSSGGSDRIYGGNGSDIIFGDNGSDDSFAGGNDVIQGDAGNDFIDGDAGNDTINGDSGEDVIYGGLGDDVLDGGADNDIVFGDNGLNGYDANASTGLNNLISDEERNAFGDALIGALKNFKIDNTSIQSDLVAQTGGGNDTINAGNDSDFIDGQSGNDSYKVSFMGGFYSAYTNIMDSGNDTADSMSVEGTIENDNLLVRASDKQLGMIALLPDIASTDSVTSDQYKYEKKKIERINYWTNSDSRGIEQISLNAGAGDDKIAVDGTLSALAVDAGAGDDTITVGQMFKSERTKNDANVASVDEFSTTLTTQGFLSSGAEHPTTITGGLGNDTLNLLHASAATSLVGGEGNDTFNIATFQKADKNSGNMLGVLQNAPVTLIGGVGGDKMNVVGSDGDDTFVVSGGTVQASGVDIQAVSIENQDVFGGAGDDSFYVLDTIENSVTHLYGNEGNDSFYNGGTQSDMPYIAVDNIDYKGHSGIIEHVVDSSTDKYMQTKAAAISVNIRDNDTATGTSVPVDILFVNAKGDIIEPSAIIEEGAAAETVYYLKLSRNLAEGERVTVNVYAPSLSEEAVQRGDRGFVFIKGEEEVKTLSLTFDSLNNNAQEVKIKAIGDKLAEGNDYFTLLHKVDFENVKCNPCRNVMLFFKDNSQKLDYNRFVKTDVYIVTAEDVINNKFETQLSADDPVGLQIWSDSGETLTPSSKGHNLTVRWSGKKIEAGTRVYINYFKNKIDVDNDCVIQMQYDTSRIQSMGKELLYDHVQEEFGDNDVSDVFVYDQAADSYSVEDKFFEDASTVQVVFEYEQIVESSDSQLTLNQPLCNDGECIITAEIEMPNDKDGSVLKDTLKCSYGSKNNGCNGYYTTESDGSLKIFFNYLFARVDATKFVKKIEYTASIQVNKSEKIEVPVNDKIKEIKSVTSYVTERIRNQKNASSTSKYYYKTAGRQLIICDAKSGQPVSITGTIKFHNTIWSMLPPFASIPDEPDPVATTSKFEKMYKEDTVGRVVITQSSGSTDVSETSGVTDTYAISLAGPALENKETVRVYINSLATIVHLEDGTTAGPEKQVEIAGIRFLDVNNNVVADISAITGTDEKKGQYVEFNASNYNGFFEITVKGMDDNFVESDSPKLIAVGENTIENIKGALFEDGAGRKPDFDLDNPLMVRYGVKPNESKDEQNNPSATYNKVQTKMAEKMESADEYASVDRMFVNNMDNGKDNAASSLKALDEADSEVKERGVGKIEATDSLEIKIEKSDSELYDSDKFALRFNHSDISASGINFGNMEYAEINLGSGTDKVNINKTVYREDGFQTFTVVNSGSGKNETATGDRKENAPYDDEISINSYAAEERSVIASVSGLKKTKYEGSLNGAVAYSISEITFGEGFGYNVFMAYSSENSVARANGLSAKHRVLLDVEYTDGTIQRREIVLDESSATKVTLLRDFTPVAAGVEIKSASLITNLSGDGVLVVNAQGGDDKISAMNSEKITREDLVLIGGTGADTIDVATNAIVFGDRGQVEYRNEEGKVVTRLGSLEISKTDKNAANLNKADYTTPTSKDESNYFQTDGVVRDAFVIKSMSDDVGGNDIIKTHGDKNVAIGGAGEDLIHLEGNNNVALGDNGLVEYESTVVDANNNKIKHVYGDSHKTYLHHIETTSDTMGGKDEITTGNGNNVVMGGTASDKIVSGDGNDIIIGDGGEAYVDRNREALLVSNQGRNLDGNSAGSDVIKTIGGDNVILGGLNSQSRDFDFVKNEQSGEWETTSVDENNEDLIVSGSGKDVVFGDNAYASFRGNYKMVEEKLDTDLPTFQTGNSSEEKEIKDTSILSFNFTGDSDKRITPEMEAGVESAKNWNNISGHLSGTYGNNDNEIVRFDDGTRASAISVSYGGHENHRNTSTDSRINLQGYNHWFNGNDGNTILMNSGLMSTAPNQQCGSLLEVSVDGLAQYYESYDVIVYLDIPDSHSSYNESVRKITLSTEDGKFTKSFYIDDRAGKTFSGSLVRSYNDTAEDAIEAVKSDDPKAVENYVVFRVDKQFAADRIIITVEDGLHPYSYNGKDLPGIAGLQIKGDLHKQDVAVSTDIDFGGNDVVDTNGGDDIVVGGTGNDVIVTYGDERYSIDDNDVVYGDNAKLLFADRDNDANTATTLTKAESIAATNLAATYDDAIRTGDGNDVVVGGIGSDAIFSGDVKVDDGSEGTSERFDAVKDNDAEKNTDKVKLDNLDILSFNFTANNSGDEARVDYGVAAGVVVDDDWHDFYRNDRGILMCDDTKAGWPQNEYEERVNKIANEHEFNTFATVNGVNVDLYGRSVQNYNSLGLSAYTQENAAELDGDTANSKIFNSSLALHSQEEIILKLSGLNNYLADKESGETKGDQKTYDVYVYLGGDNDNSDTYNFVYDVYSDSYGNYAGEHRYVNDWVGHFFDGDYREATCKDADKARVVAKNGVTPRVEMIGNYVVFRGVTGDKFTVHIRNYNIPETNQWPKNLPVITAVQIVTGKGRFELNEDGNPKTNNDGEKVSANVAIGGDHDKDLVFGDDAYLEFDFDIPYGVGENINDFQNRVVSANSMAIKHDDAVKVDTRDIIYTGKDRDVVVGGEDADTIKTGAADDVVVGDNANLMMEHNNPIGVFTPSNEITLDDHTIDTSTKEDYLGHDNVTVETIQRKYDPNWGNQNNGYMGWGPNGWGWYSYNNNNARGKIDGIKEPADTENTGRKDNIVDDEGSNLLIEGQWGTEKLYDPESLQPVEDPNVNTDDPNNGNEDPNVNTDDPNNGNEDPNVNTDDPNNGNEDPNVNTDDPNNENQDLREVFVGNMYGETKISIGAGETIKLVITNWDKGDQWYTPNIGIKVDASGRHSLVIKWDELGENASQEQSGNPEPISFENVAFVDIPNTSNVENEEKIVLYIHSEEAFQFSVYLINLG